MGSRTNLPPAGTTDQLREKFETRLAEWKKVKYPEFVRLIGELIAWGACVGEGRRLWDLLESQIDFLVRYKTNASPEKIIEELFASKDANEWMYRLQIP